MEITDNHATGETLGESHGAFGMRLTVTQAYNTRIRRRRKPRLNENRRSVGSDPLGRFLNHITKTAECFIDDAGFAKKSQAAVLLPLANAAIGKLELIRELLASSAELQ